MHAQAFWTFLISYLASYRRCVIREHSLASHSSLLPQYRTFHTSPPLTGTLFQRLRSPLAVCAQPLDEAVSRMRSVTGASTLLRSELSYGLLSEGPGLKSLRCHSQKHLKAC